jgi:cyanophycinase-like exopeptidase
MAGYFLLCGGHEFEKGNEAADKFAIEQVGADAPIVILATTAEAGKNGVNWYRQQGAKNVEALTLSAEMNAANPEHIQKLYETKLIYLSGSEVGLFSTLLKDSPMLAAIRKAHEGGAILAGASSGAAALGSKCYDPKSETLIDGLELLPGALFVPNFNGNGRKWLDKLLPQAQDMTIFCVEDKMAVIGRGANWQVFGRGWVTIYEDGKPKKYQGGQPFRIRG